jgi:hypothetical protein
VFAMPKSSSYRRPSLKQLAFGFLMLLAKDFARAETPMTTTGRPTQLSLTHCEHPLNDITPILTPSGLWSLAHFKDETSIGNTLSFLTDHPEIKDICDQHGENYLFRLATHGSNDEFSSALAMSKPQHTHTKNLADESLMDVLIEQNNLHKINALLQTLHEESLFKHSFKHLTKLLLNPRKKNVLSDGFVLVSFIASQAMDPMGIAAKTYLMNMIEKHNVIKELSDASEQFAESHDFFRNTLLITSAVITLSVIALFFFCVWRTNNNNPGNNPNALFNQPNANLPAIGRLRTEPARP